MPIRISRIDSGRPLSFKLCFNSLRNRVQIDLYASIDLVTDKLERQIRKYKTKVNRKSREKGFKNFEFTPSEAADTDNKDEESKLEVVRTKRVSLKPMDNEEAILQMDMLGHDFFIYEDAETDGVNIVYRRNDGRYGLIEADNE